MNIADVSTGVFRPAIQSLATSYPKRFAIGVFIGYVLIGSADLAAAIYPEHIILAKLMSFGELPTFALGLLLSHLPLLAKKRPAVPVQDQAWFDLIDEMAARGGLSETQRKIAYKLMLDKAVQRFSPKPCLRACTPS
jgi:hypothetical protein